ncbi:Di-sulfide bridge nucleocytoplasmic transport domain-containing protein [Obelidium mucronatum]|nr:Di-sulfide bridge nucleocytoplasmic transport domain-containing protein [Obelidium mucronatum]
MDVDDHSSFAGWTAQAPTVPIKPESPALAKMDGKQSGIKKTSAKTSTEKELQSTPASKDKVEKVSTSSSNVQKRKQTVQTAAINSQHIIESPGTIVPKPGLLSFVGRIFAGDSRNSQTHPTSHSTVSNHLLWPYILMGYLRLAFTLFTMCLSVYLIFQFIKTVQHDLEMKAVEYSQDIIQQVHDCSKMYLANKCSPPEHRVPAMQQMCSDWELCMNRDPHEIGRLKVGAEAIAEVLNRLFEPLSVKTMIFGSVLFFGTMYLYFTAPSFENLKTLPPQLQHHIQNHYSPQHHSSQTQFHQLPTNSNAIGNGSFAANPSGIPQFGVAAGAAQMHHHYYGVSPIHGAHTQSQIVDRGLRQKPGMMSGMSLLDDEIDDEI